MTSETFKRSKFRSKLTEACKTKEIVNSERVVLGKETHNHSETLTQVQNVNCSVDSHFACKAHIKMGSENSLLLEGLCLTTKNGSKDEIG